MYYNLYCHNRCFPMLISVSQNLVLNPGLHIDSDLDPDLDPDPGLHLDPDLDPDPH